MSMSLTINGSIKPNKKSDRNFSNRESVIPLCWSRASSQVAFSSERSSSSFSTFFDCVLLTAFFCLTKHFSQTFLWYGYEYEYETVKLLLLLWVALQKIKNTPKQRNEINQINDMIWFNDMNDVLLWYDKW